MDKNPSKLLLYVVCYVSWLVLSALGLWLLWQLRVNMVDLAFLLGLERWAGFIHHSGILLLGILWVVFFIVLEDYLRKGVKRGDLGRRALGVFLFQLALFGLSYAFQYLAPLLGEP